MKSTYTIITITGSIISLWLASIFFTTEAHEYLMYYRDIGVKALPGFLGLAFELSESMFPYILATFLSIILLTRITKPLNKTTKIVIASCLAIMLLYVGTSLFIMMSYKQPLEKIVSEY